MRALLLTAAGLVLLNAVLLVVGRGRGGLRGGRAAARVGLVFDVGGRGDKSFNDLAYAGLRRAETELGVEVQVIEPGDGADRESGIRLLSAQGFDLVVGVGFIFSDDMYAVAREHPGVKYLCIDYAKFDSRGHFIEPPPNLRALKFREHEGAFLVGALAGLTSATSAVGFVGGMDIPLIHRFETGYRAGVLAACPSCRVLVGYAGITADAFKNPGKGKELAMSQYGAGADIIFHASGSTGLGVFEAARKLRRLAIGVDADQYAEAPGHILTSMIKRVDLAVFETIRELIAGRFGGGVHSLGLREQGLDYVYDQHNRGMISAAARRRVEEMRIAIIEGRLAVPSEARR
jgi:basic membrane protein A